MRTYINIIAIHFFCMFCHHYEVAIVAMGCMEGLARSRFMIFALSCLGVLELGKWLYSRIHLSAGT